MALTRTTTDQFFVWITRGSIGILLYLAAEIRSDIKILNASVPVIQQQIIDMKEESSRIRNRVFAELLKQSAKKEDELNISQLLNLKP